MIKQVFFDLGGVLYHFRKALTKIAQANNLTYQDFQRVFAKYRESVLTGKMSAQDLWQKYETELSLKPISNFDYIDYWTDQIEIIPQTNQLMIDCSKKYQVGLLTNLYAGILEKLSEKDILPDIQFEPIINSSSVRLSKSNVNFFKLAQTKTEIAPKDIFYIDDKKEFLENAKILGWQTNWFDEEKAEESVEKIRKILTLDSSR